MAEVTEILERMPQGDSETAEGLLVLVYGELRRLAAQRLARESPGQSLEATALVHEAYVRLVGDNSLSRWNGRGHFFGAAAEAMRRILVENARRKASVKYGGQRRRVAATDVADTDQSAQIIALDEALSRLAAENPLAARVVELHHFAGLSHEIVAENLGITLYQARQKWTYAQAWLRHAMID